jgi:hypothetical protein
MCRRPWKQQINGMVDRIYPKYDELIIRASFFGAGDLTMA